MLGKFSHLVVSSMLCVPLDLFRSPDAVIEVYKEEGESTNCSAKDVCAQRKKVVACTVESDERQDWNTTRKKPFP